MRQILG